MPELENAEPEPGMPRVEFPPESLMLEMDIENDYETLGNSEEVD